MPSHYYNMYGSTTDSRSSSPLGSSTVGTDEGDEMSALSILERHLQRILHGALLICAWLVLVVGTMNISCFSHLRFAGKMSVDDDLPETWANRTCQTLCDIFAGNGDAGFSGLLLQGFAIPFLSLLCGMYLLGKDSELTGPFTFLSKWTYASSNVLHRLHILNNNGDPNMHLWTLALVLLPCLFVSFMPQTFPLDVTMQREGVQPWQARMLLLANATGMAAVVALAFFLVPASKHSPLLKVFGLSFTQALVFHRVSGWISLAFTMIHGLLHCLICGFRGSGDEGVSFWKAVATGLIPPARCWTWEIFLYETDWSLPGDENDRRLNGTSYSEDMLGEATFQEDPFLTDWLPNEGHERCYGYWRNFMGLTAALAFILLAIASLPLVRRKTYWFFYSVHIPMAWIMMVAAIAHYKFIALILVPNIIYYLATTVPVCIQQLVSARYDKGVGIDSITLIDKSDGCYAVRIRRSGSSRRAHGRGESSHGAVCRLCVPEISAIWHPFSTMEETRTGDLLFLIRSTGVFTKALLDRFLASREEGLPVTHKDAACKSESSDMPTVLVDGVYPAEYRWLSSSLHHDKVLFLAGGVGIVPFLSLLSALNDTIARSPRDKFRLRHVVLHWYCREEGLVRYICKEHLKWFLDGAVDCMDRTERFDGDDDDDDLAGVTLEVIIHLTSRSPDDEIDLSTVLDRPSRDWTLKFRNDGGGQGFKDAYLSPKASLSQNLPHFFWFCSVTTVCLVAHRWHYKELVAQQSCLVIARTYILPIVVGIVAVFAGILHATGRGNSDFSRDLNARRDTNTNTNKNTNTNNAIQKRIMVCPGRPMLDHVIDKVVQSHRPGAFFCGPRELRVSVKSAIAKERRGANGKRCIPCAVYDEQAEM